MKNFLSSDVAPPTPQPNGKVMLDALTGMRFVAAIGVYLVHFQMLTGMRFPVVGHLGSGLVGFYFLLSGFILTHVYPSGISPAGLLKYATGRLARIWPVHFACMALMLLVFRTSNFPQDGKGFASLGASALLVQSWIVDMPTMVQFNGVAWSLSVEVFFYALFPFLSRLDNRRFALVTVAVAFLTGVALFAGERIGAASASGLEWAKHASHFTPPMRLLEFLLGMATARWFARLPAVGHKHPVRDTLVDLVALGMVAAGFLVFGNRGWIFLQSVARLAPVSIEYLSLGTGFALPFLFLITWFARSRGAIAWILSRRVALWLGETTFTFYMTHFAILQSVLKAMPQEMVNWRWILVVSLVTTLSVSAILHLWIEKPGREMVLALCERKPREIGLRLRRQLIPVRAHAPAFAAVGFLCLSPWISPALARIQFPISLDQEIAVTPQELRGVVFRDEARMVAIAADYAGDRFRLKAVYERLPYARGNLKVHVLGSDGKIRQQLRPSIEWVVDETGKALIIATVNEPITRLEGTTTVGVVFWSKESKAAPADRGPRSMGGHRLHIYQIPSRIGSMPRPRQNSGAGERRG